MREPAITYKNFKTICIKSFINQKILIHTIENLIKICRRSLSDTTWTTNMPLAHS